MHLRFPLRGSLPLLALPAVLLAQGSYQDPLPPIRRVLDAVPSPAVLISPDRSKLLLMEQPGLPSIAQVATPELRLAGVVLNPRNNALSRARTYSTMVVQPIPRGDPRRIVIPWHSRVGEAQWAPNAGSVAFTLIEDGGVSLWLADATSGAIRMLAGPTLNGVFGSPCRWMPSGDALLCRRVVTSRRPAMQAAAVPVGPLVQESGGPARVPIHAGLAPEGEEREQVSRYFSSQLILVPLVGEPRAVGPAGIYSDVKVSPDGKYLLVETLRAPRAPRRSEVWDLSGSTVRAVADRDSGAGPRELAWRPDAPATLSWLEGSAGGGDRLFVQSAPFSAAPVAAAELAQAIDEVYWGSGFALLAEPRKPGGERRAWLLDLRAAAPKPRLLAGRWPGDAVPVLRAGAAGPSLQLSRDGRFAFLTGTTMASGVEQPYLDRLELAGGALFRIWKSDGPYYESVAAVVDAEAGRLLTQRESASEPPNYYLRDLKRSGAAQLARLTSFADPAPDFAEVSRQPVTYLQSDGVRRTATLYLPPGYDRSRGKLPLLFWIDSIPAPGSPYRFCRPEGPSPYYLALAGYAVLDHPSLPADLGRDEAGARQLVAEAQAAVGKVVAMGVVDPRRIAVGGYAEGANLAATLLGHSDLFRAGIAQSASYQPASAWSATERIKAPLLLIHGLADDSTGVPLRSESLFAALKGTGARPRLVLLPAESQGYRARESIGHVVYEMVTWMDRWVKQ